MENNKCSLFHDAGRPKVCSDYKAEPEFCGADREEAFELLDSLND
jgi:uncharacterized protein